MNALLGWEMEALWYKIVQNILNQFPGAQTEEPTHQRPRGSELLFCFDVG